jgi:hypothetical protein
MQFFKIEYINIFSKALQNSLECFWFLIFVAGALPSFSEFSLSSVF